MTPGDVVDFCRFGQHRAVVLAVDPRGFVIIQCTSHQRGDGGVEVPPRGNQALSLGWSRDDNRTSYFYPSGIFVVAESEITPLRVGQGVRRCHAMLFVTIRERVGAWARARQITEAAAAILFPAPPPDAS